MQINLLAKNPTFGSYSTGIYVFGVPIQYYAIVIVTGMVVAALLSALLMKRRNMDPNFIFTLFVFCIPSAILGARLFSCLTDPDLGLKALFDFPWAGLSITGGVIGGVLAGFIVCICCKVNFLRAADCVVVCILVGQIFGRWGNYFNGEVYGQVVTNPNLQWFPFAVDINGTWHYAFFFYESFVNCIGFAILYTLAWKFAKKPNGVFMFSYFVWYGTVRSIMEPFRDRSFILDNGGIWWSEVFAVLMIIFGVAGIATLCYLNYKKEGAIFGSKTGDPCGVTKFLSPDKAAVPYYSKINMLGANYPVKPEKGATDSFEEECAQETESPETQSEEDKS